MSHELAARSGECHGNLIIGEFSAALNPASLRSGDAGEQDRQRRVFVRAELDEFERHCAGWFFWTYRKDTGWDAGWCLKDTVVAEITPNWYGIRRKPGSGGGVGLGVAIGRDEAEGRKMAARDAAVGAHEGYWRQFKGHYEPWRFSEGFERGWDDAFAFFAMDVGSAVPEIGFKGQWAKRRAGVHVRERGKNGNVWEFGE